MRKIELLAPSGSMESLYAAVQAGADAVYLGGNKFSARAYASNFDNEGMIKAVKYCHLYNVKIYVTINTIMKENELEEALKYAKFLYEIGVDALIIQDIGLASLINKHLPDFELHASTQMTVHNGEGALFLKSIGFKRIVLSRELSVKEIKHISQDLGVETEIFIHGALCVCYSGQCLMSSMIGGRSGNRGRCAQPCRLPYNIINRNNGEEKKGYLLSPKDICTIENVKDIVESGTSSLKIEGRMKRPEYVAGVVSEYRRAIDRILNTDREEKKNNEIDIQKSKKTLLQLFNREGFSKAYLYGNVGKDMMAYSFPKNTGVELGRIESDMTVLLSESIAVKDGVRNGEGGFTVSKIIKEGKEVTEALAGERVKLMPSKYKKGDLLYKTSDLNMLKDLELIYKSPYERKLDLKLEVKFKVEEPLVLTTYYNGVSFDVDGERVQSALKRPLSREKICENLGKAGDTVFKFKDIEFKVFEEGFLPISTINEARRELINRVQEYILTESTARVKNEAPVRIIDKIERSYNNEKNKSIALPNKMIVVSTEEQLKAVLESSFKYVCINPFEDIKLDSLDGLENIKLLIKVPNIIREEFNFIVEFLEENLNKIEGIITSNLGIISKFSGRTNIIGDYKLNIFNSETLGFFNKFASESCLSVELNRGEIRELIKNSKLPAQLLVYGKTELMVSEYCAIGSTFGEKCSSKNCNKACKNGNYLLVDRKGEEFLLKTDRFCRSYIYNSVPTNLIDNIDELRKIGLQSFRIDFIDESYEQTKDILSSFEKEQWKGDFSGYTRGHYKRGVE